jgi:hypothetical protein
MLPGIAPSMRPSASISAAQKAIHLSCAARKAGRIVVDLAHQRLPDLVQFGVPGCVGGGQA